MGLNVIIVEPSLDLKLQNLTAYFKTEEHKKGKLARGPELFSQTHFLRSGYILSPQFPFGPAESFCCSVVKRPSWFYS